eukprot:6013682-Ditylum_brightwellii.AAC.1
MLHISTDKKLPPAPVALNKDEVEKFGLLEEQMEKYESVHGIDGEGSTGEEDLYMHWPTVPFCLAIAAAGFNDDADSIDDID